MGRVVFSYIASAVALYGEVDRAAGLRAFRQMIVEVVNGAGIPSVVAHCDGLQVRQAAQVWSCQMVAPRIERLQ